MGRTPCATRRPRGHSRHTERLRVYPPGPGVCTASGECHSEPYALCLLFSTATCSFGTRFKVTSHSFVTLESPPAASASGGHERRGRWQAEACHEVRLIKSGRRGNPQRALSWHTDTQCPSIRRPALTATCGRPRAGAAESEVGAGTLRGPGASHTVTWWRPRAARAQAGMRQRVISCHLI